MGQREETFDAALMYAALGVPIFPIRPNAKEPARLRGFHDSTTDVEQITEWFGPDAIEPYNIGCSPAHLDAQVFDADVKDGRDGIRHWQQFMWDCGGYTPALVVDTPSGGKHFWYAGTTGSNAGVVAEGVDIRSERGYVLLPPSIVNGRRYEFEGGMEKAPLLKQLSPLHAAVGEKIANLRSDRTTRAAPEFEIDPAYAQSVAHRTTTFWIRKGWLPAAGSRDFEGFKFFKLMHSLGVSAEYAKEQYERFFTEAVGADRPTDPTDHDDKITRIWAGKTGDNPAGSELKPPAGVMFGNAATGEPPKGTAKQSRLDYLTKQYLSFRGIYRGKPVIQFVNPNPILTHANSAMRIDLVPNMIEAGVFVPISGPGSAGKSTMCSQIAHAKLWPRELFPADTPDESEPGIVRGEVGHGPPVGGIQVVYVEGLLYEMGHKLEDAQRRWDYRERAMGRHFTTAAEPDERFAISYPGEALIEVFGKSQSLRFTDTGFDYFDRWDDTLYNMGHFIHWLDSFFDAIDMDSDARFDDSFARKIVNMVNRWYSDWGGTCLAPFHPSKAGVKDKTLGYSPAFHDKARCALRIDADEGLAKKHIIRKSLHVHKWNDGPEGLVCTFRFRDGQIVKCDTPEIATGN